ncbi:MAG: hypothetical protein U1D30_14765 [Planctomycetota bacterium]
MTVKLEIPADAPEHAAAGVHVLCRDKSVRQSLRVVLGSCGLGYVVTDAGIVVAPSEIILAPHRSAGPIKRSRNSGLRKRPRPYGGEPLTRLAAARRDDEGTNPPFSSGKELLKILSLGE